MARRADIGRPYRAARISIDGVNRANSGLDKECAGIELDVHDRRSPAADTDMPEPCAPESMSLRGRLIDQPRSSDLREKIACPKERTKRKR
jgi:hypothetical protein